MYHLIVMAAITITNLAKITMSFEPRTSFNDLVNIQGFTFEKISGDGEFISNFPTNKSIELISGPNPGETVYKMTIVGDFGNGLQAYSELITMNVTEANQPLPSGASLNITFGSPQLK